MDGNRAQQASPADATTMAAMAVVGPVEHEFVCSHPATKLSARSSDRTSPLVFQSLRLFEPDRLLENSPKEISPSVVQMRGVRSETTIRRQKAGTLDR